MSLLRLACLLAMVTACSSSSKDGGKSADQSPAAKEAASIFQTRCTPCHGAEGHGDGTASAALNPKPRNFHDQAWQKSVTDDHIRTIIRDGGAAVGKSSAMPPNPDLVDNPAVLTALKDHVRAFGNTP